MCGIVYKLMIVMLTYEMQNSGTFFEKIKNVGEAYTIILHFVFYILHSGSVNRPTN